MVLFSVTWHNFRDPSGSPGFTVAGGVGSGRDGIYVSHITPGGSADRQKLMVMVALSPNGNKMVFRWEIK